MHRVHAGTVKRSGSVAPGVHRVPRAHRYCRRNVYGVGLVAFGRNLTVTYSFIVRRVEIRRIPPRDAREFAGDLNICRFVGAEVMVVVKVIEGSKLLTFLEDFSASYHVDCKCGQDTNPAS